MTTAKARPTDFTGRQRDKQLKEHAAELAARADEISLQTAAEAERLTNEIVDVTKANEPTIIDEIENVGVSTADNSVVMRVNTDIEDMTFGKGNTYTFKVGVKYKVHKDLHDYLDDLGYVWH